MENHRKREHDNRIINGEDIVLKKSIGRKKNEKIAVVDDFLKHFLLILDALLSSVQNKFELINKTT